MAIGFVPLFGQGLAGTAALSTFRQSQLEFGEKPNLSAFMKGESWGKSRNSKFKVEGLTQRGVSRWFSGISVQPFKTVEFAWWFSPEYVSARLGYLSAKEYWEAGKALSHFRAISDLMNGKLLFMVQLASAPDYDILEDEFPSNSKIKNIELRKFVLKIGDSVIKPNHVSTVFENVSRNPDILKPMPWYQFAPCNHLLTSEFEEMIEPCFYPMGDFQVRLVMVEFDISNLKSGLGNAQKLSLRIIGPSKERYAEWNLDR